MKNFSLTYKIEKTKNDEYSVKRRDGKSFKTNFTVLPVNSIEFASLDDAVLFLKRLTLILGEKNDR